MNSTERGEALEKLGTAALEKYDYGEDAGCGSEDQSIADYVIPFITVLQSNSPQCDPGNDKYVEGARQGLLFNTVTQQLYEDLCAIPVMTQRLFMEWIPRKKGGGLRGQHAPDSVTVKKAQAGAKEFGRYQTDSENDLVETFYVYWLITSGHDKGSPAMMAFTSTKIQPYKRWNTNRGLFKLPNGQSPPLFANEVCLSTVRQQNDKGAFYNIVLSPSNGSIPESLLAPSDERMAAAKLLRESIKSGMVKVDYEGEKAAVGGETTEEDIPF